jgi:2'-5' RNA ligase
MRLFVAVDVGDAVRREVARVVSSLSQMLEAVKTPPRIVWVKPAALHVTIKFLGEIPDSEVPSIVTALTPPLTIEPFTLQWRGLGAFPGPRQPRALWLGVVNGGAPLARVEAEVSRRLAGARASELEARAFLPHLTLGRIKMPGSGIDWPKVLQAVEVRDAQSSVDRVTLYRSALTPFGPNYTGLVSAPLVGAGTD